MPGTRGTWDLDAIDQWRATRQWRKDRTGTLTLTGRPRGGAPKLRRGTSDSCRSRRAKAQAILADAQEGGGRPHQGDSGPQGRERGAGGTGEVEEFLSKWLAEARNIFKPSRSS